MSVSEQDKATLNAEVVEAIVKELKTVDFVSYFLEVIEDCEGNMSDVADTLSEGYDLNDFIEENMSISAILSDIFISWLEKAQIQITVSL